MKKVAGDPVRKTDNFGWALKQLSLVSAEFKSCGMMDYYAQIEAIAFLLQTPEYYVHPKNFAAIEKYGTKNGLVPNRANLTLIYKTLAKQNKLVKRPKGK